MRTPKPLLIFSALGALASASASLAAAVDTSAWKCTACPYEKGSTGTVEVGVGTVSDRAAKFIDMSGLDKGGYLVLGGSVEFSDGSGWWGKLAASELGLDTRSLTGQIGQEGLFTARLAYDNLPRQFADVVTPLAGTLQPLKLGYDRSRLEGGLSWTGSERWTVRVNARRDEREGTRPGAAAFFATAAQLAVPVDHVTNQLEVSAAYVGQPVQATLSYHLSTFSNGQAALNFTNPFPPVVDGATAGQLAGAPDNEFHQVAASLVYQLNPEFRASADVAVGRMTQNAAYLPLTLTPGLPTLPPGSLDGRADTFNGALRFSYVTPIEGLRLNASYARDVRDSDNVTQTFPAVATDYFVGLRPVTNTPLNFFQDRYKFSGDYRASSRLKASAGVEHETRERAYSEVVMTRESTVWARVAGQPRDDLSLSLKVSRANRGHSDYGVSTWTDKLQNPLLRKYNLAKRDRVAGAARADWTATDKLSLGLGIEGAQDDYTESVIGLTDGRSLSLNADVAYAFSEATTLRAWGQAESMQSRQAGSQLYAGPDWTGRIRDRYSVFGVGARHMAMDNKLELGADLTVSRSRSRTDVDTTRPTPAFPVNTTSLDRLKLSASYQLKDNLSLVGTFWHERYESADWHLDGVQPDTVPYVLAFGTQSPQYRVNVLQVSVRYRY
jgi:MtrB/PioB family decaheme-associated outer membrane protein